MYLAPRARVICEEVSFKEEGISKQREKTYRSISTLSRRSVSRREAPLGGSASGFGPSIEPGFRADNEATIHGGRRGGFGALLRGVVRSGAHPDPPALAPTLTSDA